MGEYAGLYAWLYLGFSSRARRSPKENPKHLLKTVLWSFLSAGFFALCDELYQTTVPGRGFQLADLGLDSLGMLIAIVTGLVVKLALK